MKRSRRAAGVAFAVVLSALAAACGGGAEDLADGVPVDAGIPAPSGVGADRSAANAVAALGPPGPVDARSVAHTLHGTDAIGGMRDVFVPGVRPREDVDAGGGSAAGADEAPAPTPVAAAASSLTVPTVPTPPPASIPTTCR